MTLTLILIMLLVWVSLGMYGKEAPAGCLMLTAALPILLMILALKALVLASTLGRRNIHIHVEDT